MNPERFATFSEQYKAQLAMIAQNDPSYFMAGRSVNTIAENMIKAIEENGIRAVTITNSKGFTATAKALGIPCTYKAFETYLNGSE